MRIRWKNVEWTNSLFLIGTCVLTLTAVPLYFWHFGWSWFQAFLFVGFFMATGLSITLGYHRLFSHLAFRAAWPVRLFTLLFGAAAFEKSALIWSSDHRRHHKNVDQDDDPYDISKGFWYAHIGWILFKLKAEPPYDNVNDLRRDPLVMWQHRYYVPIAVGVSFVLPALIGLAWGGWTAALGSFLIAGVARVMFVQQMTFFINSLCHTLGAQPYSSRCTARDSALMAVFTFGEGYHNFHHEFQHDYRNGVKPWQFDPTKWSIWLLNKAGLVRDLRRIAPGKILLAEMAEKERQLAQHLRAQAVELPETTRNLLQSAQEHLHRTIQQWEELKLAYRAATEAKLAQSRESLRQLKAELARANAQLQQALEDWNRLHQLVATQFA